MNRRQLLSLGIAFPAALSAQRIHTRQPPNLNSGPLPEGIGRNRQGDLRVGDAAPDFELKVMKSEQKVRLSSFKGARPVALVFGSYTCPTFRSEVGNLNAMFKTYKDHVEFLLVYVREAHATDGRQIRRNEREGVLLEQAKDFEQKEEHATLCVRKLAIEFTALVDPMDNQVELAYTAWPDRMYLVGRQGLIAYKGAPGPAGLRPPELELAIKNELGIE